MVLKVEEEEDIARGGAEGVREDDSVGRLKGERREARRRDGGGWEAKRVRVCISSFCNRQIQLNEGAGKIVSERRRGKKKRGTAVPSPSFPSF